jgi:FAD/FMN-containing dehydrogenase
MTLEDGLNSIRSRTGRKGDEMAQDVVGVLRSQVAGEVVAPGDADYEDARRVYNGMIDRRPAAVVCCHGAGDVAAAVRLAAQEGLDLSVRGGGHSAPGFGTNDEGVVVD